MQPCLQAAPLHSSAQTLATEEDVIDLTRFHGAPGPDLLAKVDAFLAKIDAVQERGYYLWRSQMSSPSDRESALAAPGEEPRRVVLLSSNNYLGLTTHPRVLAAHREAAERFGTGSGSAPFFSGTYLPHRQLEQRLARWKGTEDCCLFPSGYAANIGVLSALCRDTDTIYLDRLVHASIHDGARLSGARLRLFRHNDPASLDARLRRDGGGGGKLVVVDAVYSMDGDLAPLPELLAVARRHGAVLLVDEAHATGVLGARGGGLAEHFGLASHDFLSVGTLSKALASVGGFLCGPRGVVEYVRHFARSAMFSTALPPSAPAAALAALSVLEEEPQRVARLQAGGRHLSARLRQEGLPVGPTASPIVPVLIGEEPRLLSMARALQALGVHGNCVFYPAVARGQCRLRFTVMASHTAEDLEQVVQATAAVARRFPAREEAPPASAAPPDEVQAAC